MNNKIVTAIKVGISKSLKWCLKINMTELCSTRKHLGVEKKSINSATYMM